MDETDYELLDKAYETLQDVDYYQIVAIAERYVHDQKSLDLEDIKIMAAYLILNAV